MATDAHFVDFIMEQLEGVPALSMRKMFGECAIYSGAKVVALVCDNQLFIKATDAGRGYIGTPVEASPCKGAKPSFLIQEQLDEPEWLAGLVRMTEEALPLPKPKAKKPNVETLVAMRRTRKGVTTPYKDADALFVELDAAVTAAKPRKPK